MSLREKMNENPGISAGIAGAVVLLTLIYLFSSLFGGGGTTASVEDAQVYYTTDDGATYTPGPASDRMNPDRVIAHVYTIDDGKTQFVGYLERWTPAGVEAFKKLEAAIRENKGNDVTRLTAEVSAGREVKKPKGGNWVKLDAPEASAITSPRGPKGEEDPVEYYPPLKP